MSFKYLITVPRCGDLKEQAINIFYGEYNSYCCAVEYHVDQSKHIHFAIDLNNEYDFSCMRLNIRLCLGLEDEHYVDIQPIKNWNKAIEYITKSDLNPLYFNVNQNCFAFRYLLHHTLLNMGPVFQFGHPFVAQHRRDYRYIYDCHTQMYSPGKAGKSFSFIPEIWIFTDYALVAAGHFFQLCATEFEF